MAKDIKTAVIAVCNSTPAIVTAFAKRITPDRIPDKQEYPHARVIQIGGDQRYSHQGESGRKCLVQIDVWHSDSSVDTYAELLRSTFSGYKGNMGSSGSTAGMIKASLLSGNFDEITRKFKRIIELEIMTND